MSCRFHAIIVDASDKPPSTDALDAESFESHIMAILGCYSAVVALLHVIYLLAWLMEASRRLAVSPRFVAGLKPQRGVGPKTRSTRSMRIDQSNRRCIHHVTLPSRAMCRA
jgi:hypothetical protein